MDIEEIVIIEDDDVEEIRPDLEEATNGTSNYNFLANKPKINNIVLTGNKTAKELGLQEEVEVLSNIELEKILK